MPKRLLKLAIALVVWLFDVVAVVCCELWQRPRRRAVVLYYHAIPASQRHLFARQMDLLLQCGTAWSPDQRPCPDARHLLVVTFDDGFTSVIENALPELRSRNIPSVLFCPTGCWGMRPSWVQSPSDSAWWERVMAREELQALASDSLIRIGSHSISHPNLLRTGPDVVRRELAGSKAELEHILGRQILWFAFPYGAYDAELVSLARAAGYERIFTTTPAILDPDESSFIVGRVSVEPDDWPLEFRLKLAGAYRWQSWIPRRTHSSRQPAEYSCVH